MARVENKNDSTLGFKGTIGFAAPELYQSGLVLFTNAIDTYAFGVTAWYLSGEKVPDTLFRIPPDTAKIRSFSSLNIDIPAAIISLLDRSISENPNDRPLMSEIKALLGKYLLRGKHRALIIYGTKTYVLEKIDQVIKLDVPSHGSLHIKYNGLDFFVEVAIGSIFANNNLISKGQLLPKNCVLTLGDTARGADRLFVTFDISNPEVVL